MAGVECACYSLSPPMDRLLARLEKRMGRYALPNLIVYVVVGMALVWVLSLTRPEALGRLVLDMNAVKRGQVWRLGTFLFIPPQTSPIWVMFNLYFTWWVGSSLEQHWGAFKFNVYYFIGVLCTIIAACIAGATSNTWLDSSLFLAFATTFPDVSILLFFVLPIRVKWLGIFAAVALAVAGVRGDWGTRASIAAALVNYAVFFAGFWRDILRRRSGATNQKALREERRATAPPSFGARVCAICGAREADGTDIRVCSCAKCGGQQRALCLVHARNH